MTGTNAFILAAAPWVLMGLCLAIVFAVIGRGGTVQARPTILGISIGAVVGLVFGLLTGLGVASCAALGALLGETFVIVFTNRVKY